MPPLGGFKAMKRHFWLKKRLPQPARQPASCVAPKAAEG